MPDSGTLGGGPRVFDRTLARMGLALLIGIAGAVAARSISMPLPYLLGPLLACGSASIMGAPLAALPYGRELGQVAVGLAIGLRFVPIVVIAIAKLLPFMLLATILMIAATMVAALLLQRLAGTDRKTAFFATAAAGLAEMAVVAHQKNADSDTVAVVHLIRVTSIVTIVPFLVTIFGEDGGIHLAPIPFRGEAIPLIALFVVGAAGAFLVRRFKLPNSWLLVPGGYWRDRLRLWLWPFCGSVHRAYDRPGGHRRLARLPVQAIAARQAMAGNVFGSRDHSVPACCCHGNSFGTVGSYGAFIRHQSACRSAGRGHRNGADRHRDASRRHDRDRLPDHTDCCGDDDDPLHVSDI